MRCWFYICLLLGQAPGPAFAFQAFTGAIDGVVTNGVTGEPVGGAKVTLNGGGKAPAITTDANGRFHFDVAAASGYLAEASADGYSPPRRTAYSRQFFTLTADKPTAVAELHLRPLSSITGRVLNEDHEPVANLPLRALRSMYAPLGHEYIVVGEARTDEKGRYRFTGIEPGPYLVVTGPLDDFAPSLFPGVASLSETSTQQVRPGTEWIADFKLRKASRYRVQGRVIPSPRNGGPIVKEARLCGPDAPPMLSAGAIPVHEELDGAFSLSGMYRGTYCFSATVDGKPQAFAPAVTIVDSDLENVEISPEVPFSVRGQVKAGDTPATLGHQFVIALQPRAGPFLFAPIAKDGSFEIEGVTPGAYTIVVRGGLASYVRSMSYGGQDVTGGVIPAAVPGVPLTVVFGSERGELSVSIEAGPLENTPVMVVVIPPDAYAARQDLMRIQATNSGQRLLLSQMAPGDYRVFALTTSDAEDSGNWGLLKLLEGSSRTVTVRPSGRETVTVTPIPALEIEQAKERVH